MNPLFPQVYVNKITHLVICFFVLLCTTQLAFAKDIDCQGEGESIQSIEFLGLKTTRRRVLDRQISLQAGDILNCEKLGHDRQAIEDLGLFKKVSATSVQESGGLKVEFSVIEKRYLIVLPHLGTSESGSFTYGVRGRWSNIGGLNQRANLKIRKKTFNSDVKDSEKKAIISFLSPQIRDSDFDANIEFGYIDLSTTAFNAPNGTNPFNEVYRYSSLGVSRWFHQEQRQHGFKLGSAISWRAWRSDNPELIGNLDKDQSHLGLEFSAHYNKVHDRTYSFDGHAFTYRIEPSIKLNGDRSPLTQELYGEWHNPVGSRDYSEIEVQAGLGWSNGAYSDFVPFQNSASAQLRGISYEDFEGDRYYYFKLSYLTPYTFKPLKYTRLSAYPSLRAEVFAEIDDIYFQDGQRNRKDLAWSVGTGVRWRIPWLVGLQVGAGLAYHSEEKSLGFYISGR